MTGTTASKGQQVSDLLALLADLLGATQVVLTPQQAALAREGLCLLAKQEACAAGRVAEVAAAKASRPHPVAPMDVRDRLGAPSTTATRASYPLHATCGVCNEPATLPTLGGYWYHPGRAAGWPAPQQPLANDDPPGRQRDQVCPEHGSRCVHL